LCAGVLLWVWVGLLTRLENPARLIALYVTIQAALLMALSTFFATTLLSWGGAMAGFAALAALYGLMALLATGVPPRFDPLVEEGGSIMPDRAGWIGLTVVCLQLAAILALWVYIKPFGKQIGLSDATTGLAVSIALGSQIFAGLAATALAGRVRSPVMLIAVGGLSVAAILVLLSVHASLAFIAASTVFAFLWLLGPPFHMPYLIEIDASRRAAIHMATAQLVGIAIGPALASLFVSQDDVRGAMVLSAFLYMASAVIVAATSLRRLA
jgi:MFS transporter, DHA1 family, inner membrane transport protein